MVFGRRAHVSRAAVQASIRSHYYSRHAAQRRRVYLPPRKVQDLAESLDHDAQTKLAEVGLQIADQIDESKPVEDQLAYIEDIWRERFEAIVEPMVEEMKQAVVDALEAVTDESLDSAEDELDAEDSQTATPWLASAVLILSAALGGGAIGSEAGHGHYASAVLWALTLLVVLRGLLKEE